MKLLLENYEIDVKKTIIAIILIIISSVFYYITITDMRKLSSQVRTLKNENHIQQKRLDKVGKKINNIENYLKELRY